MFNGIQAVRYGRGPFVALVAAFAALAALPASAQPAPVPLVVLASGGLKAVLETLHADAERAVGRPVAIQFAASRALKDVIETGQPFDVAIVTPEVLEAEIGSGKVKPGSRRDLALTSVALAQRGGRPHAIATADQLKTTLLGAKSIRYNPIGSGRPTIDRMLSQLSIDPASLAARTHPLPTAKDPPATLAEGEYELSIMLNSEVPDLAPGAANLGPIPAPFQIPVRMAAGVGDKGDDKAAKALIDFLRGPIAGRAFTANRMTPLEGKP